ncbi:RNA-directed DNA polymerase, eukaryota, reverse transcriptase zinc-binding domain protein [Tanacetum coccineum]
MEVAREGLVKDNPSLLLWGRGLRQGGPISSYLFTLVMEVFNMILIRKIRESNKFKYHHGCKELKLTHMCFADDLLVLCNGDKSSLEVIKKSLEDLSNVSRLFPNLGKSIIFFESINEGLKRELLKFSLLRDSSKGKAIVAWNLVFRPKEQGCLGIKPLKKWTEVILEMVKAPMYGMRSGVVLVQLAALSLSSPSMMQGLRWIDENNKEVKFSTKSAWKCLREDWPKVEWHYVVWFS